MVAVQALHVHAQAGEVGRDDDGAGEVVHVQDGGAHLLGQPFGVDLQSVVAGSLWCVGVQGGGDGVEQFGAELCAERGQVGVAVLAGGEQRAEFAVGAGGKRPSPVRFRAAQREADHVLVRHSVQPGHPDHGVGQDDVHVDDRRVAVDVDVHPVQAVGVGVGVVDLRDQRSFQVRRPRDAPVLGAGHDVAADRGAVANMAVVTPIRAAPGLSL